MTTQQPVPSGDAGYKLTRRELLPLVGGRSTWSQEHLLPIFATVCVGLALFIVVNPTATGKSEITEAWQVYSVIGVYVAFMVNYYVNLLCDRPKHLWMLGIVALCTMALLASAFWPRWAYLFYNVIPGTQWEAKSSGVVAKLAGFWLGTGLCEEGFKALPLFALLLLGGALAWLGRHSAGRLRRIFAVVRRNVGLCGPLDGIVFGAASGTGFFINETLGQYVPGIMADAKYAGSQAFSGLVLLLARGILQLAGHSAYAGLFGYFIGLSVLRPRSAVFLIPFGWLCAAALHGAWDATDAVLAPTGLVSDLVETFIYLALALLSYALLGGAIFQARAISLAGAKPQAATAAGAPVLATAVPAVEAEWDSD